MEYYTQYNKWYTHITNGGINYRQIVLSSRFL